MVCGVSISKEQGSELSSSEKGLGVSEGGGLWDLVWLYKMGLFRAHKSWMGKREAGMETWSKALTIAYSHEV